jgi:hypothetical protein
MQHNQTPAMAKGLAEEPWSVERIVFTQLIKIPLLSRIEPSYFKPWRHRVSLPAHNHGP